MDIGISVWLVVVQCGSRDCCVVCSVSEWILGFQCGYWDFSVNSGIPVRIP